MSSDAALVIEGLSKTYRLFNKPSDRFLQGLWGTKKKYFHEIQALQNISLRVPRGKTVGIIGRNGSGKSTLLQIICGTVQPTSGACRVQGRISALLELGAGFNPEFTGEENVRLNAAILGMSPEEIEAKYPAIEAFAGIGAMIRQPVKTYSSGMYVRLAFAVAVASDPDILVVDEALAVGDEAFQRKCYARLRAIQERGGTILFVSHSASTIVEICDHAVLLEGGQMLFEGAPKDVVAQYHKLLYAPEEKIGTLRQALQDSLNNKENALSHVPEKKQAKEFFDPALQPESCVHFEPNGAIISNPRITTLEGQEVNMLVRGGCYQYHYDVALQRPAEGLQCGMMVKTKSGVMLGGGFHKWGERHVTAEGRQWQVTFTFNCALLPGAYFTNAGCSALQEGERVFLHRIMDAVMFKVLPEEGLSLTGTVDLQVRHQVQLTPLEKV